MAAATAVTKREAVFGDWRIIFGQCTIATTGDTLVTGLKSIKYLNVDPTTAIACGATASGGTITFAAAASTIWYMAVGH